MTYSHNLIYRDVSTINFVTWSLEIEAQFYLTAPFLVALLSAPKRGLRVGLTIFVMAVWAAGSWYAIERVPLIGLTLAGHLHYFLCGFLLAAVHLKNRGNAGHSYAWDAIALVAWCLLVRLLFSYTVWSAAAKPFVVLIAYIAMFRGRVASAIITFPVLAVIGGMCYTIYLYHSFMIATLGRFTFRMVVTRSYELNVLIQAVVLGAGVALWGGVLFLLFEKPFMYRDWPAAAWARAKRIVGRPIEADAKNDVNE
jgi:peptidoglycan/LPS O-acetylase OafA/YrhL